MALPVQGVRLDDPDLTTTALATLRRARPVTTE